MPTYDYSCRSCGKVFEQTHGFNGSPSPCVCGSSDLPIIIHPPTVFVKGEATTIGQLSERNTKQMGRYELEDKRREQNKGNNKKKKDTSWYQKTGSASASEIKKMTPEQKANYIQKGKK
mgnify:FL=1